MNEQTIELSRKAEDLLDILERDIEHIERTVLQLNELRGFVIKRDEKGLGRLLEDIRAEGQEYPANEQRRRLIRERLSELLGCDAHELTLSILKTHVPEPAKTAIVESQKKLRALVGRLQREYVSTVALLSDCARINSLLLKIVFGRSRTGLVCYDSAGQAARESDAAFMSMRL
jgi:hypothetical protein